MSSSVHRHGYQHTHMWVHTHIIHTCIYTYTFVHTHAHTHTYIHTHSHTHSHNGKQFLETQPHEISSGFMASPKIPLLLKKLGTNIQTDNSRVK